MSQANQMAVEPLPAALNGAANDLNLPVPAASGAPVLLAVAQKPMTAAAVTRTSATTTVLFQDNFQDQNYSQWSRIDGWWSICDPAGRTFGLCATQTTDNAMLAGSNSWTDYTMQSDVVISKIAGGRDGMDVVVRAKDANHFYELELVQETDGSKQWQIWRNNGGNHLNLARGNTNFVVGGLNIMRFQASGSSLTASMSQDNGATFSVLGTATDTLFPAGKVGLRSWSGMTGSFDNVTVTTTSQTNASPTPSAVPTAVPPSPSPVPTTSGVQPHMIAGCQLFPVGDRMNKDITKAATASNSASMISASAGIGKFNSIGDGDGYLLHVQSGPNDATTRITPQKSYHSFPNPWPIAAYTAQSQAGASSDHGMEIVQLGETSMAYGCQVWDGYNFTYLGGGQQSANEWSGYSGCQIDPSKPEGTDQACNSTSYWAAIAIAGGIFPEELSGSYSGWSRVPTHALVLEIPDSPSSPLHDSNMKLRLHANYPEPSDPQAKFIVDSLKTFGAIAAENGCCFNIARHFLPQPGHPSLSFNTINPVITKISITDFDVMASNN